MHSSIMQMIMEIEREIEIPFLEFGKSVELIDVYIKQPFEPTLELIKTTYHIYVWVTPKQSKIYNKNDNIFKTSIIIGEDFKNPYEFIFNTFDDWVRFFHNIDKIIAGLKGEIKC